MPTPRPVSLSLRDCVEVQLPNNHWRSVIGEYILEALLSTLWPAPHLRRVYGRGYETILKTLVANADEVSLPELERSLLELSEFRNCWTHFKRKGLGESLSSFRNAMALGQLTEDTNPLALTLSTVHTMKGLERDIVFLSSMCEGVFPDYRATSQKDIDEERNSAFVAVTRARRWIYMTYPQQRKMPWGDTKAQQPSRFLREMNT